MKIKVKFIIDDLDNNVFTSCPSTMLLPYVLLLIYMCFP